jgi:hypothetical protein
MPRRDRWFIALAAAVAVAATSAFALTIHQPATPKGCTTEIVAGPMGGETHVRCGSP